MNEDRKLIAEVGSVHDGSFGNACRLIEAAGRCGADIVKFQTHLSEAESLPDAPAPAHFSSEPRWEYFRRTGFDPVQWRELRSVCAENGVDFLSSPFSLEAVELLEYVDVDAYKIASGEVTNLPLLEAVAKTGKPVFLSSGMSNWAELDAAFKVLDAGGAVTVMQCSSAYPCPPDKVGLNVISDMVSRYSAPIGFSDHTEGFAAAFAAAALGACVIEKHFTFSKLMYGSDAPYGMEPNDFEIMCRGIREIWDMLAAPVAKDDIAPYEDMRLVFQKSIVTTCPIPAGTVIDRRHIAFKKPGTGISPAQYKTLIGRKTARNLPADWTIADEDLA